MCMAQAASNGGRPLRAVLPQGARSAAAAKADEPFALEAGFVDAALAGLARSTPARQREVCSCG